MRQATAVPGDLEARIDIVIVAQPGLLKAVREAVQGLRNNGAWRTRGKLIIERAEVSTREVLKVLYKLLKALRFMSE